MDLFWNALVVVLAVGTAVFLTMCDGERRRP